MIFLCRDFNINAQFIQAPIPDGCFASNAEQTETKTPFFYPVSDVAHVWSNPTVCLPEHCFGSESRCDEEHLLTR